MRLIVVACGLCLTLAAYANTETGPTSEDVKSADVILTDDAQLVSWTTKPEGVPVTVRASSDPDAGPEVGVLVSEQDDDGEAIFEGRRMDRTYFTVSTEDGAFKRTAVRLLPLEGGRNFRDLGGYETGDGHTLKWGRLFRSGSLIALTDNDYDMLTQLGVATVIDLRSNSERKTEPTDWRAGDIEMLVRDYERSGDAKGMAEALKASDATPEKTAAAMKSHYRSMPKEFASQYAQMFDRLAMRDAPLLFHCSGGKDRTGVGSALLLTALGVPRETIMMDYALTDTYEDYVAAHETGKYELVVPNSPYSFLRDLPTDIVAPLLRSDPSYLEAAFEQIETDYGSVMHFITSELNVDEGELAIIRNRLLEKTK